MAEPVHELIPLEQRDRWQAALADLPRGPAHSWEFTTAMRATSAVSTYLYRYVRDDAVVVCPLAERAIGEYVDVTTPLGFNGFAGSRRHEQFAADWRAFATAQGWICGYVGLHPVFCDGGGFPVEDMYVHNQLYLLDLRLPEAELIGRLSRNRRRQLHDWSAVREGLVVDRDALTAFLVATYADFFARRGGGPATRLAAETLTGIASMPNSLLVGAAGASGIDAVLVVAYTSHCADAVFSVSLPGGERHAAHLNWYAIERLRELGVPVFNMGGGLQPSDDIAEFKRRFGALEWPLRSIRQVYDADAYRRLCRDRGLDPEAPRSGYFPAYRR